MPNFTCYMIAANQSTAFPYSFTLPKGLLPVLVALLFLTGMPGKGFGQSIWTNPITGATPNLANPYTSGQTVNANITVSGIGRGIGIIGNSADNRYNANGWNSSSLDFNDYFEFTLTPTTGYEINFTDFTYTGQASGAGPINFALRSSIDGFSSDIATPPVAGTTINLPAPAYQSVVCSITFRLYGYNAPQSTGTFSVNDFVFKGVVNSITNPSLTVSNMGTPSAGFINASATNVILSVFNINANTSQNFTGVTITKTGTTNTADLDNVRIFWDQNANGIIDGADASVSGAGIALANTMAFTLTGQTFSCIRRYLVVADVLGAATLGNTVTTSVASSTDITSTITTKTGNAIGNEQTTTFVSSASDYFRSNVANGDWTAVASWQSSHDNTNWYAATLVPTSSATSIIILNGHLISITSSGISMKGAIVKNGGNLKIATATGVSYTIADGSGDDLIVESGGILSLDFGSAIPASISGSGSARINGGGRVKAITTGGGTEMGDNYLATGSKFLYENNAIFEWLITTTTLGTVPGQQYFKTASTSDLPVFLVSATPASDFGASSSNNTFNCIFEVNAAFPFGNAGTKTIRGGIRGTGTVTQTGGAIILPNSTSVLDGSVTINMVDDGLEFTNGAIIPLGANVKISATPEDSRINKLTGSLLINGTLDVTDLQIRNINNAANNITINGKLKTANKEGLSGPSAAPPFATTINSSGTLIMNTGNTIEYNALINQAITSTVNYDTLIFSGAGIKTPNSSITATGKVKITGASTVVDATNYNIGGGATKFEMDGGRFILGTTGTQPNMTGAYNITGGLLQYTNTSVTGQTIRNATYNNIEVVGKNVANSSGNITLIGNGSFIVKPGAIFTMNTFSIKALDFTTGQSITVENNGTFKTGNIKGFNGHTISYFPTISSSINSDITTITLAPSSTVEYIRDGDQPITNAHSLIYQNLTITGATGIKTAPAGVLIVQGNLVKSGASTFDANGGTVLLNGGTQSFAGLTYNNLHLDNAGTKTLSGNTAFLDSIRIGNLGSNPATILDLGNNDLTLRSNVLKTARAGTVAPAAVINYSGSGRFVVERYFPALRAWRMVTSPLSSHNTTTTIFSQWQNNGVYTPGIGAFVTGPNPNTASNGLDNSSFNNYSLKAYQNNDYVNIGNTLAPLSNSTLSAANIGYFMFVRGDRSRSPDNTVFPNTNNTTLSSRGKLQIGSQTFPGFTRTEAGTRNFALIGNPYPSPVDFDRVARVNLIKRFVVWDPKINSVGAFVYMDDLDNTGFYTQNPPSPGGQDKNIQSGQAFFVETDAALAASSISFYESGKSSVLNLGMFRPLLPAPLKPSFKSSLYLVNTDNSATMADGNLAEFNDNYNEAVDLQDALKFTNINETFGLVRNNTSVAMERRPTIAADDTLYFNLTRTTTRNYQFRFEPNNLDPLLSAFLEDAFTGSKTPLSVTSSGFYDFTINNLAASAAANRFRVVFRLAGGGPLPVTFSGIKAYLQGKNIAVEWTVENELNISNYEVEKSIDGINFRKVNNTVATGNNSGSITYNWLDINPVTGVDNYYRIRGIGRNGKMEYSRIAMVKMGKGVPGISIYTNPVADGTIGLQFNNMPSGNYHLRLVNNAGQSMLSITIKRFGGSDIQSIIPGKSFVKGIYHVEITCPDKTITTLKVMN